MRTVIVALLAAVLVVPGFLQRVVTVAAQQCGQHVTFDDCAAQCYWCDVMLVGEGNQRQCVHHSRCSQHSDCRDVHYGTMAALFDGLTPENNNGHSVAVQLLEYYDHPEYCSEDVPQTYLFIPDCNTCVDGSHQWCQYDLYHNRQFVSHGGLCSDTCDSSIISDQFRGDSLAVTTSQAANRQQCAEVLAEPVGLLSTTTAEPTTSGPTTTTEVVTTTTEKATTATASNTANVPPPPRQLTSTAAEAPTPTATTTMTTDTAATGGRVSTATTATAGQVSSSTSVKTGQTSSEATNVSGAATTPITFSLSAVATMAAICVVAVAD